MIQNKFGIEGPYTKKATFYKNRRRAWFVILVFDFAAWFLIASIAMKFFT